MYPIGYLIATDYSGRHKKARLIAQSRRESPYLKAARVSTRTAIQSARQHRQQWPATLAAYAYPRLGSLDVKAIDTAAVLDVFITAVTFTVAAVPPVLLGFKYQRPGCKLPAATVML